MLRSEVQQCQESKQFSHLRLFAATNVVNFAAINVIQMLSLQLMDPSVRFLSVTRGFVLQRDYSYTTFSNKTRLAVPKTDLTLYCHLASTVQVSRYHNDKLKHNNPERATIHTTCLHEDSSQTTIEFDSATQYNNVQQKIISQLSEIIEAIPYLESDSTG